MLNERLCIEFGDPSVCHFWWDLIYKLHYIMHEHAACCGLGPAAVSCSAACTRPGNTNSMEYKQDWRLARCRGAVLTRTIDHGIVLTEHKLPIFSFFSYFHILNKLTSQPEVRARIPQTSYFILILCWVLCCMWWGWDEVHPLVSLTRPEPDYSDRSQWVWNVTWEHHHTQCSCVGKHIKRAASRLLCRYKWYYSLSTCQIKIIN